MATQEIVCEMCGNIRDVPSWVKRAGQKYCSRECYYRARRGSLEERFWTYVDKSAECWLWTGTIQATGYGSFCFGSKILAAHRTSYELFVGPIPEGQEVLHSCDVRHCVNPSHLFVGTQADNIADMKRKGRHVFGERHPRAKLTEEQVREIRRQYDGTEAGKQALANKYRVSRHTIHDIVLGYSWTHLDKSWSTWELAKVAGGLA